MTATLHTAGTLALPAVHAPTRATLIAAATTAKDIALFALAPFIGLVYAAAMPIVGLAMLLWMGTRALVHVPAARQALITARDIALFAAAPLIGLVYAVTLPFVGTALIARAAYQAYRAE
ncbi:MAG: hypothetical protein WCK83_10100 [Burkholderiales bacterium]